MNFNRFSLSGLHHNCSWIAGQDRHMVHFLSDMSVGILENWGWDQSRASMQMKSFVKAGSIAHGLSAFQRLKPLIVKYFSTKLA